MFQKSNRHLYKPIQKIGAEFIYSVQLSYWTFENNVPDIPKVNSTNVPVPLFAPNMFETFYNEITTGLGSPVGVNTGVGPIVGVSNYGGNLWNGFVQFDLGANNHTTMFPYNAPDITGGADPFFTNTFYYKIATGNILQGSEDLLSGWVKIDSARMAYLNFMRILQTKRVHCSKMNFQWTKKSDTTNNLLNNPILLFDQKITGQIETNEFTLGRFFNPDNQSSRQNSTDKQTDSFNIDVPCDWILSASSGVSIGWDCVNCWTEHNQPLSPINVTMTINFTLHEIE